MKEEIRKGYWSNGQLRCETPYVNEKIHGFLKAWHSNGELGYKISYKNNLQHGAKVGFQY